MRLKRRFLKWLGGADDIELQIAVNWIRAVKRESEQRWEFQSGTDDRLKYLEQAFRRFSLTRALDNLKAPTDNR